MIPRLGRAQTVPGEPVWDRLALLLLCAAALLRAAYLFQSIAHSPVLDDPLADSRAIVDLARKIAAGGWQQAEPYYRAPLVPYLLAPLYAALRRPETLVAVLQVVGGLAGSIVLWNLARSTYGVAAGFTTLLLAAFFGPVVSHETKILSTAVAILLSILAMQRFVTTRRPLGFLLGGGLLGLGALAQPSLLLAAPLAAVAILRDRDGGGGGFTRGFLPFAAGIVIAVSPASIHNIRAGDLVVISSNGGMTFYHGNNESSRWGLLEPSPRVGWAGDAVDQAQIDRRVASRENGRLLRASESSAYWFAEGLRILASDPGRAARLWGTKIVRFVGPHDYADNYSYAVERAAVRPLALFAVPFTLILLLAVAGLILSPPRTRADTVVISFALVGLLTCVVFFVGSRYRCLSAPALAVLGGRAIAAWPAAASRRRVVAAIAAAGVAAVGLVPAGEGARLQDSMAAAQWAAALDRTKRPGAERFYELATRWDPSNAVAWGRRAHIAQGRGGPAAAIEVLSAGVAAGADGKLLRLERGMARIRMGDLNGAEEDLRVALFHAPADPTTAYQLGSLLVRVARDREAAEVFALPSLRGNAKALFQRARLALRLDDPAGAATLFDSLLAAKPRDESMEILRALAWTRAGEEDRARRWLREWLATRTGCDPGEWTEKLITEFKRDLPEGPIPMVDVPPDCWYRVMAALSRLGSSP